MLIPIPQTNAWRRFFTLVQSMENCGVISQIQHKWSTATPTKWNIRACIRSRLLFKLLCCWQWFHPVHAAPGTAELVRISAYSFTKRKNTFWNVPASQCKRQFTLYTRKSWWPYKSSFGITQNPKGCLHLQFMLSQYMLSYYWSTASKQSWDTYMLHYNNITWY